jgi:hypothetical protein
MNYIRAIESRHTSVTIGALLFAMPAIAYQKDEPLVTEGLVCDHASEIDAVMTLAAHGDSLEAALAEINHGAEKPRCFIASILFVSLCEDRAVLLQSGQRLSDPQGQGLGRWHQATLRHNYAGA